MIPLIALTGCATKSVTIDPVYFPSSPGKARVVHLKSFNSLSDIVPSRVRWVDIFRGRPARPYVATPAGIAYHEGHLFICDTGLNALHDWDLTTGKARRIGMTGDAMLAKPVAVAVSDGDVAPSLVDDVAPSLVGDVAPSLVGGEATPPTIYVADTGREEVVAFDEHGTAIGRFKPPDRQAYKPVAVAVDRLTLYVADIASHMVDVFSTSSGKLLHSIGQTGSEPGKFYFPMGAATNSSGYLFVSDMMNARVQVFDREWHHQLSMGQPGDRYGDMGKPRHLSIGPDGTIFIADSEFAHIHLFNSDGRLLLLVGGPVDKPGGTPMPIGVATAATLPDWLASLVPEDFEAAYYLFTTNTIGSKRISLFAVGSSR